MLFFELVEIPTGGGLNVAFYTKIRGFLANVSLYLGNDDDTKYARF